MAWGPILQTLEEREQGIANALKQAELAKEEMASLKSGNEQLLKEAREERDRILKEAKEIGDRMRAEAKDRAAQEGAVMLANAQREIETQKKAAIQELKNQVASLSIQIAEQLVKDKLSDAEKQNIQLAGREILSEAFHPCDKDGMNAFLPLNKPIRPLQASK